MMGTNTLDKIIDKRLAALDRHLISVDSSYCRFEMASVANDYAKQMQLFLLDQFINDGLQVRRANEHNTLQWWYADGSNAEGEDLSSLIIELECRFRKIDDAS